MIPVRPKRVRPGLETLITAKGLSFLERKGINIDVPVPNNFSWKNGDFWVEYLDILYLKYSGICAYSSFFLGPGTGKGYRTADHFLPKSKYPGLAYRWDNLRLCSRYVNSCKGETELPLDPFRIREGWFRLEFVNFSIYPSPNLNDITINNIKETIRITGIDDKENRDKRKFYWLKSHEYRSTKYLEDYAPFIYFEAVRQGLITPGRAN
jgi:hypothetical protein